MTVWAVHHVRDNVSPAEKWGTIRYINFRYIFPDELIESSSTKRLLIPEQFSQKLADAARKFNVKDDYMLIVGDHIQFLTFGCYLTKLYGGYMALRFDRQVSGYYPVWIGNPHNIARSP